MDATQSLGELVNTIAVLAASNNALVRANADQAREIAALKQDMGRLVRRASGATETALNIGSPGS